MQLNLIYLAMWDLRLPRTHNLLILLKSKLKKVFCLRLRILFLMIFKWNYSDGIHRLSKSIQIKIHQYTVHVHTCIYNTYMCACTCNCTVCNVILTILFQTFACTLYFFPLYKINFQANICSTYACTCTPYIYAYIHVCTYMV